VAFAFNTKPQLVFPGQFSHVILFRSISSILTFLFQIPTARCLLKSRSMVIIICNKQVIDYCTGACIAQGFYFSVPMFLLYKELEYYPSFLKSSVLFRSILFTFEVMTLSVPFHSIHIPSH